MSASSGLPGSRSGVRARGSTRVGARARESKGGAGQRQSTTSLTRSNSSKSAPRPNDQEQHIWNQPRRRQTSDPARLKSAILSHAGNSTRTGDQAWRDAMVEDPSNYKKRINELYQTLKENREHERKKAIKDGFLADPEKPTSLANAITPVGTCQDMCPEFERVERIVQQMVDSTERVSSTKFDAKVPCEDLMVKRFRRSAAGYDEQLPSDIRPPLVLQKTLNHLFDAVIGGEEGLKNVHKFVWDRTRGIRNDFSIQQVTKVEDLRIAIDCFERIARFHILCLHQLSWPNADNGEFSHQQEREQLNNTLLSLMYYYDDSRHKLVSHNEAEFRAYCVIFEIQDQRPDLEDRAQNWPGEILKDPRVQTALKLYAAAINTSDDQGPVRPRTPFTIAQANGSTFFTLIKSNAVSYVMACVAEIYFNLVRSTALSSIWKAYKGRRPKEKIEDWTISDMTQALGFDDNTQTTDYCQDHGFAVETRDDGEDFLDLGSVNGNLTDKNVQRKQMSSRHLVERKRLGRSFPAIINGLSVSDAQAGGFLSDQVADNASTVDDESQSLFLPLVDEEVASKSRSGSPQQLPATDGAEQTLLNPVNNVPSPSIPSTALNASLQPQPAQPILSFGNATLVPNKPSWNPFANGQTSERHSQPPIDNAIPMGSASTVTSDNTSQKINPFLLPRDQPLPLPGNDTSRPSASRPNDGLFGKPSTQSTNGPPTADHSSATTQCPRFGATHPFKKSAMHRDDNLMQAPQDPMNFTATSDASLPVSAANGGPSPHSANLTSFARPQSPTRPITSSISSNQSQFMPKDTPPPLEQTQPLSRDPTFKSSQVNAISREMVPSLSQPDSHSLPHTNVTASSSKSLADVHPRDPSTSFLTQLPDWERKSEITGQPLPQTAPALGASSHSVNPQLRHNLESPGSRDTASSLPKELGQRPPVRRRKSDPRPAALDKAAHDLMFDKDGLIRQYLEMIIGPIILNARAQYEDDKAWRKARASRRVILARKYIRRWKRIAWNLGLVRRGRERRQGLARSIRELAAGTQQKQQVHPGTVPHNSSGREAGVYHGRLMPAPAVSSLRRQSLPDGFEDRTCHATSPLISNKRKRDDNVTDEEGNPPGHCSRSKFSKTKDQWAMSAPPHRHRHFRHRSAVDGSKLGSNSLLGNTLMRQAGRLAPNTKSDTTHTDYFQLKAMGIHPDFPPRSQTRVGMRDVVERDEMDAQTGSDSISSVSQSNASSSPDNFAESQRTPTSNRAVGGDGDDEAFFASIRSLRDTLADSTTWFQSERETIERSMTPTTQSIITGSPTSTAHENRQETAAQRKLRQIRERGPTPSRSEIRLRAMGDKAMLPKGFWDGEGMGRSLTGIVNNKQGPTRMPLEGKARMGFAALAEQQHKHANRTMDDSYRDHTDPLQQGGASPDNAIEL